MTENAATIATEIRQFYRGRANTQKYATSPDFNLREIEIEYMRRYLADGQTILDVGCGNGYSTLSFASGFNSVFTGIDFVPEMIEAARELHTQIPTKGEVSFQEGNVTQLNFPDATFDIVTSQRCLLNLPSRDDQWRAFAEISRVLKPGGRYLMLEGTLQGLHALNEIRAKFGLDPIPEAEAKSNWFSNKFDEPEMIERVHQFFSGVETTQRFGMYYFLSRVVQPLMVAPEPPRYDAVINTVARRICEEYPDFERIGHVALWVIRR